MRCIYCKEVIGPLRRLRDSEFCSDAHRRKMRTLSAKLARDHDDDGAYEPFWPVIRPDVPAHRHHSSTGSTVVFGILLVTALIIGSSTVPSSGSRPVSSSSSSSEFSWRAFLQREGAVRYRDDFTSGFGQWKSTMTVGDGWSKVDGLVRPGRLRLWTPTEALSDYNFEFAGSVEQRAMSWAYRAQNVKNYYATKILISKPGPLPRAELVRYSVFGGVASAKTKLPIPFVVRADTVYHVKMNIRNDSFATLINGQMVDSWSDGRLKTGGVGFFAEAGEIASVRWASVSSRDNFLGHVLSYFGMLLPMPVPPAF